MSSICGLYPPGRDLSSADPTVRRAAVDYVRGCVDLAAAVGAPLVIVVPSAVGKTAPQTSREREWGLPVESIRETAEHAQAAGVLLAIEALNRFETYLVNKLTHAAEIVRQVGMPNVKLMADTFHMNIEEASLPGTIRQAGHDLIHVHAADSNREAPGRGHIDFALIFQALRDVGYAGYITLEFLPPVANPYEASQAEAAAETLELFSAESLPALARFAAIGQIAPA